MQPSSRVWNGRALWLECGPRRTAALQAHGRTLKVLVWRLAVGGGSRGGAAMAWVLPIAVVERRGGRERWHAVPDLTLAVRALGLVLAAWLIFRPARVAAARRRGA